MHTTKDKTTYILRNNSAFEKKLSASLPSYALMHLIASFGCTCCGIALAKQSALLTAEQLIFLGKQFEVLLNFIKF